MSCKTIVSLLMAGFFLCAASASAAPAAAPHTTLTIAMGDPESSEMGVVGNAFKKYVEDKTNGAIQVVCIYGGRATTKGNVSARSRRARSTWPLAASPTSCPLKRSWAF